MVILVPILFPFLHVVILSLDIDAIEGSASPRNPEVLTFCKSSNERIFEVECFLKANTASSWSIPSPSSRTMTRAVPPSSTLIQMFFALASNAFSTSSLTTEAGLSITSPAAIWFMVWSSRTWILPIFGKPQLWPL